MSVKIEAVANCRIAVAATTMNVANILPIQSRPACGESRIFLLLDEIVSRLLVRSRRLTSRNVVEGDVSPVGARKRDWHVVTPMRDD